MWKAAPELAWKNIKYILILFPPLQILLMPPQSMFLLSCWVHHITRRLIIQQSQRRALKRLSKNPERMGRKRVRGSLKCELEMKLKWYHRMWRGEPKFYATRVAELTRCLSALDPTSRNERRECRFARTVSCYSWRSYTDMEVRDEALRICDELITLMFAGRETCNILAVSCSTPSLLRHGRQTIGEFFLKYPP